MDGNKHLTDRLTVAGIDLFSVGSSQNSQTLLKRMEREAINRYHHPTFNKLQQSYYLYQVPNSHCP